jgi:carbamoyl-phosphate synthase large subunit
LKAHPQIDAVPTMGGQTALNCVLKPKKKRIWADFDVKMIGVDVNAINTEDREQFKQLKNRCSIYLQKFVLPT